MAAQRWNSGFQHKQNDSNHTSYDLSRDSDLRKASHCCNYRSRNSVPACKEPLCRGGSLNLSGLDEEHRLRVSLQAYHAAPCEDHLPGFDDEHRLPVSLRAHHAAPCEDSENFDFMALLRACGKGKDLRRGTRIHDEILRKGLLEQYSDLLIIMYAKCGVLPKAQELLDLHKSRNVFTWTTLIAAYARHGQGRKALQSFDEMQHQGLFPDGVTFACVLKVCGGMKALNKGKHIHDQIARQGLLERYVVLGNILVDMYVKCGSFAIAQSVLEQLPSRDAVSWNALITGYAHDGQCEQALACFNQMQHEGVSPNAVTFASVLKACGSLKAADKGKDIHEEISRQGLLRSDIVLGNALVDMYAKCGFLPKAQRVLEEMPSRDVISWSSLIGGYVEQGQGGEALRCFDQMQREGLSPNAVTFAHALKACGILGAVEMGEQIHDEVTQQGLLGNNVVLGTALVDMYAKCGALTKARKVLESLPSRNVVSWSALITGFCQQNRGEAALSCFEQMRREGHAPNAVTFACALKACGSLGAVDEGERIHDEIAGQGLLENDVVLGNTLIDMYVKCGALERARHVLLEELPIRNVVSWNALIGGYAEHSRSAQALECLELMQQEGLPPNVGTFSHMLNACSNSGLVEDGHMYFLSMSSRYGMEPHLEHYTCMVNLFGCAGHLDRAVRVIQDMPRTDHPAVWYVLLGACQKWGDANVGRWAFEHLIQLDRVDATAYVLMANIYAAAGMPEDVEIIEFMRMKNRAWKRQGFVASG